MTEKERTNKLYSIILGWRANVKFSKKMPSCMNMALAFNDEITDVDDEGRTVRKLTISHKKFYGDNAKYNNAIDAESIRALGVLLNRAFPDDVYTIEYGSITGILL